MLGRGFTPQNPSIKIFKFPFGGGQQLESYKELKAFYTPVIGGVFDCCKI